MNQKDDKVMKNKTLTFIGALLLAVGMPNADASAKGFFSKLKEGAEKVHEVLGQADGNKSGNGTSTSSSSSVSLANAPGKNNGKTTSKSDVEGVSVKVKKCFRDENDNVTLIFTLLNDSGSRAVCQLRCGDSVVYDDEGNTYKGEKLRFSSMDGRFQEVWDAELPKDIAVKYRMKIKDVDPDASVLKQVSIYMYQLPIGTMNGKVHLYNVPISRHGD